MHDERSRTTFGSTAKLGVPPAILAACLLSPSLLSPVSNARAAEGGSLAPKAGLSYTYTTTVDITRTTEPKVESQSEAMNAKFTGKSRVLSSDGTMWVARGNLTDVQADGQPSNKSVEETKTNAYFITISHNLKFSQPGQSGYMEDVTKRDCDMSALRSFFPLGRTPRVVVPCNVSSSRNGVEASSDRQELVLSHEGASSIELPSGRFDVHNVRVTSTDGGATSENLYSIDGATGLAVFHEVRTIVKSTTTTMTTTTRTEVIAIDR